ncbi:hypothetical protein [Halorubrum lipolyticum]|uniref:hypothetical protein n=1 Tax=Halorubrum lipolyticum TaxID=368624 RepID=UPI001F4C5C1D|nr:hypothetical protein [Halorubrum lipolyticum]
MTEPEVLAATKNQLFSEIGPNSGYTVVDTQFSTDQWLDDVPVSREVTEALAPFNHVRVGSGYPDLVGAGSITNDAFFGHSGDIDSPPLVVVEAKGYGSTGHVDTETGIVQAHDRLQEANLGFLAAPRSSISAETRALGRELNIGVLGVTEDQSVDVLEKPRVVGTQAGREASTIRFQAGPQRVADQSFHLNRPKNYLGYPFCVYHPEPTETVLEEYVVRDFKSARDGAAFLGLIEKQPDGSDVLSPLGEEVLRFGLQKHEQSLRSVLEEFKSWKGEQTRLTQLAPDWALIARRVVFAFPATQMLVKHIQELQNNDQPPTLPTVVEYLFDTSPTFAVEFFIRDTEEARSAVLTGDGDLITASLLESPVYRSVVAYQFKQMLYHSGILAESGSDSSNLEPQESDWRLEQPI